MAEEQQPKHQMISLHIFVTKNSDTFTSEKIRSKVCIYKLFRKALLTFMNTAEGEVCFKKINSKNLSNFLFKCDNGSKYNSQWASLTISEAGFSLKKLRG